MSIPEPSPAADEPIDEHQHEKKGHYADVVAGSVGSHVRSIPALTAASSEIARESAPAGGRRGERPLVCCGDDHKRGVEHQVQGIQKDADGRHIPADSFLSATAPAISPSTKYDHADPEKSGIQKCIRERCDRQAYGSGRPVRAATRCVAKRVAPRRTIGAPTAPILAAMHFVLVHGAYHGAWCWDALRKELDGEGYSSTAVDLPCEDPDAGAEHYADEVIASVPRDCGRRGPGGPFGLAGLTIPDRRGPNLDRDGDLSVRAPARSRSQLRCPARRPRHRFQNRRSRPRATPTGAPPGQNGERSRSSSRLRSHRRDRLGAQAAPQHWRITQEVTPLREWPVVPAAYINCAGDRAVSPKYSLVSGARAAAGRGDRDAGRAFTFPVSTHGAGHLIGAARRRGDVERDSELEWPRSSPVSVIDEQHMARLQPGSGQGPARTRWQSHVRAIHGPRCIDFTTKGAKSGEERENPSYTRDGNHYLIVASKGGAPTHPSWYPQPGRPSRRDCRGPRREVQSACARSAGREYERLFLTRTTPASTPPPRKYRRKTTRKIRSWSRTA